MEIKRALTKEVSEHDIDYSIQMTGPLYSPTILPHLPPTSPIVSAVRVSIFRNDKNQTLNIFVIVAVQGANAECQLATIHVHVLL